MPYSARTCGGGGPGGGPGGFFPGGKRGTPGTVAKTGPEDADRGPLLSDTQEQNYFQGKVILSCIIHQVKLLIHLTGKHLPKCGALL